MFNESIKSKLLTGILAGTVAASVVFGQPNQGRTNAGKQQPAQLRAASSAATLPSSVSPLIEAHRSRQEDAFYRNFWGIEQPEVRATASGALIRFDYRVLDAKKAQMLFDRKATPYLIDEKTGAVLRVPSLPMAGTLRQTVDTATRREYWMVFSNKGVVKPGSRVDVVIGNFRAYGLIVQ